MHDLVKGVEDLRTTLETGLRIERHVRGVTAGFNTPTVVVDAPGGGKPAPGGGGGGGGGGNPPGGGGGGPAGGTFAVVSSARSPAGSWLSCVMSPIVAADGAEIPRERTLT